MPESVHSTQLTVHRREKTVNREPLTVNKRQKRLGFSLIELLVVIVILGILSSFVTYTMVGRQKQARDAQRKSDLNEVKKAMQSAKNDCRGASYYPVPSTGTEVIQFYNSSVGVDSLMEHLSDNNLKYISATLIDPKNTGDYIYRYAIASTTASVCPNAAAGLGLNTAGVTDFILRTALENTTDPDLKTSYLRCKSKFSTSSPAGPITLSPAPTDANSDNIDDSYYYYVCSD